MKSNDAILVFIIFNLLSPSLSTSLHASQSPRHISAVLAFGDSTLDTGNNNHIHTLVRANHPPNGQDFPGRVPTGRYSNGELIPDFLVSGLGLKQTLPAYLEAGLTPAELETGVCFASAGAGLDDLTSTSSLVLTVDRQLGYFEEYVEKLRSAMGANKANGVVNDALIIISIGTNDMMNNYYMSPIRRKSYSLAGYHGFLLQRMFYFVQRLHKLGGQRFAIAGLPPLGCLPLEMTLAAVRPDSNHAFGQRICADQKNAEANAYNTRLQALINKMSSSLKGSKMVYVDIYTPMLDMIKNPQKYGFIETRRGCCGTGIFEMGPTCTMPLPTCPDPSKFVFWDSVHPSSATYKALTAQFMKTLIPHFTN